MYEKIHLNVCTTTSNDLELRNLKFIAERMFCIAQRTFRRPDQ